jgi:hypothetical protein
MASAGAETNPFPAGESPFHVKGLTYRNTLDFYDREVPGGSAAVLAAVRDPKVREFASQRFLPGGWYDVLPVVPMNSTAAMVSKRQQLEMTHQLSREAAQKDINGIYRFMLNWRRPRRWSSGCRAQPSSTSTSSAPPSRSWGRSRIARRPRGSRRWWRRCTCR